MTVYKDFYKTEDKLVETPTKSYIQIFFNQQVDFFNAFFLGTEYLNQSVIGYNGSPTGVLGIATAQGSGWLGGDSNALVELSNGNLFMGFGDSFYGQLIPQGIYSGTTDTETIGFHNTFSYLITNKKEATIVSNRFYVGADQNKVRSPEANEKLSTDAQIINSRNVLKLLCTSIVLGQTYDIEWASRGRTSILTPDLSNQINFQLAQKKAASGNCWPIAGMVQSSMGVDTLYWIIFDRFKLPGSNVEFSQTQILRIKNMAQSTSDTLLISPYDWDANSTIASFPNFMNQPVLLPGTDIYTCSTEWTRSFVFGKYNYLMGAGFSSAKAVYLTRATKPCIFYKGVGIEAWTANGWKTNKCKNEEIELQPIVFQLKDGSDPFSEKDTMNQLSEIFSLNNQYAILFLSSTTNLGSLTIKYQVYVFRSAEITGPYVRDELPIFDDFNPIFENFELYEMRVYPALLKYVPKEREGLQLQCIFSVVGQPYYTHGNEWYGLQSFFQVYKPQFYFYYA